MEYKWGEAEYCVFRKGLAWTDSLDTEESCKEVIADAVSRGLGKHIDYSFRLITEDQRKNQIAYYDAEDHRIELITL